MANKPIGNYDFARRLATHPHAAAIALAWSANQTSGALTPIPPGGGPYAEGHVYVGAVAQTPNPTTFSSGPTTGTFQPYASPHQAVLAVDPGASSQFGGIQGGAGGGWSLTNGFCFEYIGQTPGNVDIGFGGVDTINWNAFGGEIDGLPYTPSPDGLEHFFFNFAQDATWEFWLNGALHTSGSGNAGGGRFLASAHGGGSGSAATTSAGRWYVRTLTPAEMAASFADPYAVEGAVAAIDRNASASILVTASAAPTIVTPGLVDADAAAAVAVSATAAPTVDTPPVVDADASAAIALSATAAPTVVTPGLVDADATASVVVSATAAPTVDTPPVVDAEASASVAVSATAAPTVATPGLVDADAAASLAVSATAAPTVDTPPIVDAAATAAIAISATATPTLETPAIVDAAGAASIVVSATAAPTIDTPPVVDAEASASVAVSATATGVVGTPGVVDRGASAGVVVSATAAPTVDTPPVVDAAASAAIAIAASAAPTVIAPAFVDAEASASVAVSASAAPSVLTPPFVDAEASASVAVSATATPALDLPLFVDATASAVIRISGTATPLTGGAVARRPAGAGALDLNRSAILRELLWRATRITRANGYALDVGTVFPFYVSYDSAKKSRMPALVLYPGVGQPRPRYYVAGFRDQFLRVEVLGHVRGDTHEERAYLLDALRSAFFREIDVDNTRGGWATHTKVVEGTDSDEGTPERSAHTDGTATFASTIEVMYTPGISNRKPMRYASIHISTPAGTLLAPDTFRRIVGSWSPGVVEPASWLTTDAGILTYRRERALAFQARATLQILAPVGGVLSARFAVNGIGVAETEMGVSADAGARALLSLDDLLILEENATLELEIASTAGQTVTVERATLAVAPAALV